MQVRKRRHLEVPLPRVHEDNDTVLFDAADESPTPYRHAVSAEIRRDVEVELARMTPIERAAFLRVLTMMGGDKALDVIEHELGQPEGK